MHRSPLYKTVAIVVAAWLLLPLCSHSLYAIPQFSLITGNRCTNCHFTAQGGGGRNELGWYSGKDMKLLRGSAIGLPVLDDMETNTLADGKLTIGGDVRLQAVRSPRSADAPRVIIPMQIALHAAYQFDPTFKIEAMLDAAALYSVVKNGVTPYQGQQIWMASAILQPWKELPSLRVGHFQPSVGMRYDDHTLLVRQIPGANGTALIPPNYAEYGAELTYDRPQWLTLSAGVFLPSALSTMTTITPSGELTSLLKAVSSTAGISELLRSPTLTARVVVSPRTEDHRFNTYFGASVLNNDVFTLVNAFAGIGLTNYLSLMAEYARSGVENGRQTQAVSVELMGQAFVWLLPFVRYEYGTTRISPQSSPTAIFTSQIVLGGQIFPLPFLEFRPEYRITTTEVFSSQRWTVQMHLFF